VDHLEILGNEARSTRVSGDHGLERIGGHASEVARRDPESFRLRHEPQPLRAVESKELRSISLSFES
jgi:hypothetical protein